MISVQKELPASGRFVGLGGEASDDKHLSILKVS